MTGIKPLIPLNQVEHLVSLSAVISVVLFAGVAAFFYGIFKRRLSQTRRQTVRSQLRNLLGYVSAFVFAYAAYSFANLLDSIEVGAAEKSLGILGFIVLLLGSAVVIKCARILVLEYLFLGNSKEEVPLLIVNIFTLLVTISVIAWFASNVLGVRLAPLLATSAVFSLVLGLALQDTLGNLFAGVALRIDAPYDIGDWIEVYQGSVKFVGQVEEITWRATTLLGLADEQLTISNRVMGQAEILNFSKRGKPFWRSQLFRIPYSEDLESVRLTMFETLKSIPQIHPDLSPIVIILESTESWLVFRCSYCITQYDQQWIIGSEVYLKILAALKERGYLGAAQRIELLKN